MRDLDGHFRIHLQVILDKAGMTGLAGSQLMEPANNGPVVQNPPAGRLLFLGREYGVQKIFCRPRMDFMNHRYLLTSQP